MPPAVTVLVLVKATGPVQVASSGPKRVKVMVPVGLRPPVRVAVSVTAVPTAAGGRGGGGDGRAGLGDDDDSFGALQALVADWLLASPE